MRDVIRSLGILAPLLAVISAPVQASNLIQANVPFAFQAAGKALPAGDYRFSLDQKTGFVTISGDKLFAAILLSVPSDQVHNQRTFLRFQRHGDQWLLRDISFAETAQQVGSAEALKK